MDAMASVMIPYVKSALEKKEKNVYEKVHSEVDRHVFEKIPQPLPVIGTGGEWNVLLF